MYDPTDPTTDDPEIAALLNFEPGPRQNKRKDGWTAPLQRKFILHLALTGSPTLAAEALKKNRHGVEKVYKSDGADSFRAAWGRPWRCSRSARPSGSKRTRRPRRWRRGFEPAEPEPEPSEAQQEEQIERLANKFLRKVVAERARRG